MQLKKILSQIVSYFPDADLELIRKAHAYALDKHAGQTRASGEPYITHVMEVAFLAAKLHLDVASIVAALLHDTVEDTSASLQEVKEQFGEDVATLVDGVTKLSKVQFSSKAEQQAENFRKMLLAMSQDIRVLLLKLCDRTHNMRTLEFLSESRRMRIAAETLDIYAPLAHRLGLHWMKSELEDLSLRHLKPEVYQNLKRHVSETKAERERYIAEVVALIEQELAENEIQGEVAGRSKHFYSIYKKMEEQNLDFSEVYDLIAFRIIVPTTRDCYGAIGVIHAAWRPIPGRFKDYIAMPKPNNYQSLHTTVIGPRGHRIEIQIRTLQMHDIAERGIAAHWHYKENPRKKTVGVVPNITDFAWLRDLVESGKLLSNPSEFMSSIKEDLISQEVFVYSPRGDLIALAQDSTPIDFAYAIHSEVGNHCLSARVNGKQVPLSHHLENGDTVEIVTSESQTPSKDWLGIVVTTKAKQRIRSWLKSEERKRSTSVGKELLLKEFRRAKKSFSKASKEGRLKEIASEFGVADEELLLAEIGYGKLPARSVLQRLFPAELAEETAQEEERSALQKIFQKVAKTHKGKASIKVHGLDDVVFRLAKCCEPLPGDDVVGYVTRGRGVAVHRSDCPQTLTFDEQRQIEVSWDDNVKMSRPVHFRVHCLDQVGMLAALTQSISSIGVNIVNLQVRSQQNGKSLCSFEVNIESSKQLDAVTRKIEAVEGVLRVERRKKPESESPTPSR